MSHLRKKKPAAHINHERWMVSFADFMTLLFALFVVLFAISTVDEQKLEKVSESMDQAFGVMDARGESLLNSQAQSLQPIPPILQPASPLPPAEPSRSEAVGEEQAELMARLENLISDNPDLDAAVQLRQESRGFVLQLQDTRFFASGSAEIRPQILPELTRVAEQLKGFSQPIRIEGHTDNQPINAGGRYRSNWELSSARATSVMRYLQKHAGLQAQQFSVAGYGEFRPIDSNQTAEGRARNRRVDIVILNAQALRNEPQMQSEKVMQKRKNTQGARQKPSNPRIMKDNHLNQQLNQKLQQRGS